MLALEPGKLALVNGVDTRRHVAFKAGREGLDASGCPLPPVAQLPTRGTTLLFSYMPVSSILIRYTDMRSCEQVKSA